MTPSTAPLPPMKQHSWERGIRDVEGRLGVMLFKRTNGGTHLTMVGTGFIASAKRIFAELDTELRRIQSRSRGELGSLTIGVHAWPSEGNMRASSSSITNDFQT